MAIKRGIGNSELQWVLDLKLPFLYVLAEFFGRQVFVGPELAGSPIAGSPRRLESHERSAPAPAQSAGAGAERQSL